MVAEEVTTSTSDTSDAPFCAETEPASRETEKMYDTSIVQSSTNQEDTAATTTTVHNSENVVAETPLENAQSTAAGHKSRSKNVEINGQANHLVANTEAMMNETAKMRNNAMIDHETHSRTDNTENDAVSISVNAQRELPESNSNDVKTDLLKNNCVSEEGLTNGKTDLERYADVKEKSKSNQSNEVNLTTMPVNDKEEEDAQRSRHYNNSIVARATTCVAPPKKYNKKGPKFVREPTPGPDLDDVTHHQEVENGKLVQQFETVKLSNDTIANDKCIVHDKLDEASREMTNEEEDTSRLHDNEDKIKTTSHDTTEGSNEDSGFESQTRLSEYPITAAVTEWLRQANSPDLFVTSASTSDSETDDDEEMDAMPPKNLQGNPMPALSANSGVDTKSRTASCGEFAKANSNNNIGINQMEVDSTVTSIGRRKRDAKGTKRKTKAKIIDKQNRNIDGKAQLVSCDRLEDFFTAMKSKNTSKNNVGNVCEFTQKDSVAGMRVALSSRINSKRVNARRTKTLRKINRDSIENIDIKMRRIDDLKGERNEETNEDITVSVRTFEKGEIIVTEDGKLLPTSSYEPVSSTNRSNYSATRAAAHADVINENVDTRNGSENDENNSAMITSSVSIEEPDVLECWEAETVEPVITPRRILQSPGVLCEGEATEEDNFEIEKATMEHIEKYYRLARDSAVSADEESSEISTSVISSKSRTVPNNPEKTIEHFCGEEIPIIMPDKNRDVVTEDGKIPIDEAFEVYESYYNGKLPFLAFDSKLFNQRPLYSQHGEGPIPCRAVCCNIQ